MAIPNWPAALLLLVVVTISSVASMRLPRKKTYTGPENIPCGRNCQSYGKNTGLMSRCLRVECRKHAFRYFMRIGKRQMDRDTRFDTISESSNAPSSSPSSSSSAFQGDVHATQSRPFSFQFPEIVRPAKPQQLQQQLRQQQQQQQQQHQYDQEERNDDMAGSVQQIEIDKLRNILSLNKVERELRRQRNAFLGRLLKQRKRHRDFLNEEDSLRAKLTSLLLQSLCRSQSNPVMPFMSYYPRLAQMCRSTTPSSSASILDPSRLTTGSKVIIPNYADANDDDDNAILIPS